VIILGLNAFHGDSAAALVRDGVLLAAAEEERFRRIKHWAGFPAQSIAYCLREAGLRLGDVEHVAVNQDGRTHRMRRIAYLAAHPPHPGLVLDRLRNRHGRTRIPQTS
jgi:carbamoyltransferase